jgi:hypothetical protein
VSDEQVAHLASTEGCDALLDAITDTPTSRRIPARKRRLRVPIIVGLGVVTAGAATAMGWALTRSAPDVISVNCAITSNSTAGIPAVSGDPIKDCAQEWKKETGHAAPPLRAYVGSSGVTIVQPANRPAPPSATPLAVQHPKQDLKVIELQESLNDVIAGLGSGCYTNAEATHIAKRELTRLDMTGWSVSASPDHANGKASCVDDGDVQPKKTVKLSADGGSPVQAANKPQRQTIELASKLRPIAKKCQPLAAAKKQVEAAVAAVGMPRRNYELKTVPTQSSCTTVHETVGGTVFLTLRGPKG